MRSCCLEDRSPSLSFVTDARTFDGPVGLVGAGYIGHLFAALRSCRLLRKANVRDDPAVVKSSIAGERCQIDAWVIHGTSVLAACSKPSTVR